MELFRQSKNKSIDCLDGLFATLVEHIPQTLTEKIAEAQSDVQRNRYYEAREVFVPQQEQLRKRYRRALEQAFDEFAAGYEPRSEEVHDVAALALVDKSQYEDDVAIRTMASKTAAIHAEELWKLNRRFAVIRGGKKCPDDQNPCGPVQLCEAMRETLRNLDIDAVVKLMVYKWYDQQVLGQLGELYQQLNQELADKGILQNLNFAMARAATPQQRAVGAGNSNAAAAPAPAPEPGATAVPVSASNDAAPVRPAGTGGAPIPAGGEASAESGMPAGQPGGSAANDPVEADGRSGGEAPNTGASLVPLVTPEVERRQARVMDAIKAVQQKRRKTDRPRTNTMGGASYGAISATGVEGQADTFNQRDLAAALTVIQAAMQLPMSRGAHARKVADTENKLMEHLGGLAEEQEQQKVTAVDADTIDLVGMLFEYMLDDPQLPDNLKSLLSHLHTPYLKVALLDKEFFATARHPARLLLDLMAAAGARWLQEGDDDEKVYQRIRLVVERIIKEFDDDLGFFDELLNDFTRFVKLLEKRADLAAQRSVEAEKGLDRLSHAKDLADREVGRRLAGAELPGPVQELLEQPWSDYLVFNYLRHGDDSDSWREGLEIVERVVASTRIGHWQGSDEDLLAEHGALIELIEAGFSSLGFDRDEGLRLLGALREAQQQVRKGQAPSLDEEQFAPPPTRKKGTGSAIARQLENQRVQTKPVEVSESDFSSQEKALAKKLSTVSFGTWFEFDQGQGGRKQRLKLSWYSSVSGNYMFVNHSGIKSGVKTLPELINGMNDGSVVMLERESRNLFERAISSVLGRLNKA